MSGDSTWLWVLNATPYTWTPNNGVNNFMTVWKWPESIPPGTMRPVLIEWGTRWDQNGSIDWFLEGTPYKFTIQAVTIPNYHIQAFLRGFDADNMRRDTEIDLGWNQETMSWILSGWDGSFSCSTGINSVPDAWMQLNLGILGECSLRQICLPATHDSGMSRVTYTVNQFVNERNIVTQTMSVGAQLAHGCRYFDIRPMISQGALVCGHYSNIDVPEAIKEQEGIVKWIPDHFTLGGNGEFLSDIIHDLNQFTSNHRELIIFRISHTNNIDHDRGFDNTDWSRLFNSLDNIQCRFPIVTSSLTDLPLKSFIAKSSAVFLVFDDNVDFGTLRPAGCYHAEDLEYKDAPVYIDGVTSTEDPAQMSRQCIDALKTDRTSPGKEPCLVGWCLTQSSLDAALTGINRDIPVLGRGKSILDLAVLTKPALYGDLWKNCSRQTYPNAINFDAFTADLTAFCIAITKFYALKGPQISHA